MRAIVWIIALVLMQATAQAKHVDAARIKTSVDLSKYKAGTIIVATSEWRLFFMMPDGSAIAYKVGVGREGFRPAFTATISQMKEWPDWTPPKEMRQRRPDLPSHQKGGVENPLGARALYLGDTLYRIHGTNEPETIGKAVTSGCVRMLNLDVIELYGMVRVGTKVVVLK